MRAHSETSVVAAILVATTITVSAQMQGMNMALPEKPTHFAATPEKQLDQSSVFVKLGSVPNPIPLEKYFGLRFAVYDGNDPSEKISNAEVMVFAGMRHEMKTGFAHGMQSSPKMQEQNGIVTVSGMAGGIPLGAFKTPTLRDVARIGPYMHDGRFASLTQVLDFYARGEAASRGRLVGTREATANLVPHLTARQQTDLIAFLKTLTGAPLPRRLTQARLPSLSAR